MYRNVLDRPGESAGVEFWTRNLSAGLADRTGIIVAFSESAEHIARTEVPIRTTAADVAKPAIKAVPTTIFATPSSGRWEIYGTDKSDTIRGLDGRDLIPVPDGNDLINGFGGDDLVDGLGGNDVLRGDTGHDTLLGGEGDDTLYGGAGADRLEGGPGADVFRFFGFTGRLDMAGDVVLAFEARTDTLDFGGMALAFRGQDAFEANGQAQLWYENDWMPRDAGGGHISGSSAVYLDGDGAADGAMTVATAASLTDANFLVWPGSDESTARRAIDATGVSFTPLPASDPG